LFYLEDPFEQNAVTDFAKLLKKQKYSMVCGDDLVATNLKRLENAANEKAINAVIIKPNQAGSLIKTKDVFDLAVRKGITPVVSHRSGETMDATIAHLAFAWQAPFVKFGIAGKERLAKLNELIKIERAAA
jgi:enolase